MGRAATIFAAVLVLASIHAARAELFGPVVDAALFVNTYGFCFQTSNGNDGFSFRPLTEPYLRGIRMGQCPFGGRCDCTRFYICSYGEEDCMVPHICSVNGTSSDSNSNDTCIGLQACQPQPFDTRAVINVDCGMPLTRFGPYQLRNLAYDIKFALMQDDGCNLTPCQYRLDSYSDLTVLNDHAIAFNVEDEEARNALDRCLATHQVSTTSCRVSSAYKFVEQLIFDNADCSASAGFNDNDTMSGNDTMTTITPITGNDTLNGNDTMTTVTPITGNDTMNSNDTTTTVSPVTTDDDDTNGGNRQIAPIELKLVQVDALTNESCLSWPTNDGAQSVLLGGDFGGYDTCQANASLSYRAFGQSSCQGDMLAEASLDIGYRSDPNDSCIGWQDTSVRASCAGGCSTVQTAGTYAWFLEYDGDLSCYGRPSRRTLVRDGLCLARGDSSSIQVEFSGSCFSPDTEFTVKTFNDRYCGSLNSSNTYNTNDSCSDDVQFVCACNPLSGTLLPEPPIKPAETMFVEAWLYSQDRPCNTSRQPSILQIFEVGRCQPVNIAGAKAIIVRGARTRPTSSTTAPLTTMSSSTGASTFNPVNSTVQEATTTENTPATGPGISSTAGQASTTGAGLPGSTTDEALQTTTDEQLQSTTGQQLSSTTGQQLPSTTGQQLPSTTGQQLPSTTGQQPQTTNEAPLTGSQPFTTMEATTDMNELIEVCRLGAELDFELYDTMDCSDMPVYSGVLSADNQCSDLGDYTARVSCETGCTSDSAGDYVYLWQFNNEPASQCIGNPTEATLLKSGLCMSAPSLGGFLNASASVRVDFENGTCFDDDAVIRVSYFFDDECTEVDEARSFTIRPNECLDSFIKLTCACTDNGTLADGPALASPEAQYVEINVFEQPDCRIEVAPTLLQLQKVGQCNMLDTMPGYSVYIESIGEVVFTTMEASTLEPTSGELFTTTGSVSTTGEQLGSTTQGLQSTTGNVMSTTENIGSTTENIGSTTENIGSSTSGSIGSTTENIGSSTSGNIGSTTENIGSSTSGNIGSTTANIGSTTENLASTTANMGSTTANMGSTTANIGSTTENIGSTTENFGSTTENIETTAEATSAPIPQSQICARNGQIRYVIYHSLDCSGEEVTSGNLTLGGTCEAGDLAGAVEARCVEGCNGPLADQYMYLYAHDQGSDCQGFPYDRMMLRSGVCLRHQSILDRVESCPKPGSFMPMIDEEGGCSSDNASVILRFFEDANCQQYVPDLTRSVSIGQCNEDGMQVVCACQNGSLIEPPQLIETQGNFVEQRLYEGNGNCSGQPSALQLYPIEDCVKTEVSFASSILFFYGLDRQQCERGDELPMAIFNDDDLQCSSRPEAVPLVDTTGQCQEYSGVGIRSSCIGGCQGAYADKYVWLLDFQSANGSFSTPEAISTTDAASVSTTAESVSTTDEDLASTTEPAGGNSTVDAGVNATESTSGISTTAGGISTTAGAEASTTAEPLATTAEGNVSTTEFMKTTIGYSTDNCPDHLPITRMLLRVGVCLAPEGGQSGSIRVEMSGDGCFANGAQATVNYYSDNACQQLDDSRSFTQEVGTCTNSGQAVVCACTQSGQFVPPPLLREETTTTTTTTMTTTSSSSTSTTSSMAGNATTEVPATTTEPFNVTGEAFILQLLYGNDSCEGTAIGVRVFDMADDCYPIDFLPGLPGGSLTLSINQGNGSANDPSVLSYGIYEGESCDGEVLLSGNFTVFSSLPELGNLSLTPINGSIDLPSEPSDGDTCMPFANGTFVRTTVVRGCAGDSADQYLWMSQWSSDSSNCEGEPESRAFFVEGLCQQSMNGGSMQLQLSDGGCHADSATVTVLEYNDSNCQSLAQNYTVGINECGGPDQVQIECACSTNGTLVLPTQSS